MMKHPFSLKERMGSFKHAFNGIGLVLKTEHNARLHVLAAGIALLLAYVLKLSPLEWISIIGAIGFVFVTEFINTAMEEMADYICKDIHPSIKKIKDISAGAVLMSAIVAFAVGAIIFIPKLLVLL